MKKFLFILVIFALVALVACADSESTAIPYEDLVPASTPYEDLKSPETPYVNTDMYIYEPSFNPGGRFCTEHLAEGEVLVVESSGSEAIFDSIDNLLGFIAMSGDLRTEIIRGEILDERTAWLNVAAVWRHEGALPYPDPSLPDEYRPVTIHRVRVLEVFQGEFEAGDIIEVRQPGGQIGNVRLEDSSFVPLASGDDLVLILASLVWMPPSPAGIVSSRQAVYRFPDLGDGMRAFSADESLECVVQSSAALTLTFGDLMEFQIQNFGQVSESFAAMVR